MKVRIDSNVAYCEIKSSLISANIKELIEEAKSKLEADKDYSSVIIDLSDVNGIDSMGITFLIGMYKTITANDKKVVFTGVSDDMLNLFKIMKLDVIFEIVK